ncbi:unnamed protein product [Amoebophrya sp. A25]|nr:unnamed protein product [Amoebophrya sp. A25]|eukprot:GSA25T00014573001.1
MCLLRGKSHPILASLYVYQHLWFEFDVVYLHASPSLYRVSSKYYITLIFFPLHSILLEPESSQPMRPGRGAGSRPSALTLTIVFGS